MNPVQIIIQGTAEFQNITEEFQKLGQTSTTAFNSITNAVKGLGVLTQFFLAGELVKTLNEWSNESIRSAKSLAQLDAALRSTGQASEGYRQQLEEQRQAISLLTGVEEDQLVIVQRRLVQYKASKDQIEELTKLSLDLAASQGMDAASAANILARSLGGEEVQLRGVRLEIDRTLPKYQQIRQLIEQLTAQVGGQQRAAFLAGGQAIQEFNNKLAETKRSIGGVFTAIKENTLEGLATEKNFISKVLSSLLPAGVMERSGKDSARLKDYWNEVFMGRQPPDDSNAASAGNVDLHNRRMQSLAFGMVAGEASSKSISDLSANSVNQAGNELAYFMGKKSLAEYLKERQRLITEAAHQEQIPLIKALDAATNDLAEKKKELEVVQETGTAEQVEKISAEFSKVKAERDKLAAQLKVAQDNEMKGNINQKKTEGPTTFGEAMTTGWGDAVHDLGTAYTNLANTIRNTVGAAIGGVSQGITGLIEGTLTWSKALQNIGTSVLNVVIDGLVKMFAAMVIGNQTVGASEEAKQAATLPGALISMVATAVGEGGWAAAAIIAAGVAAGFGAAAAFGAFAQGGRPPVGEIALVGERGPELFVPDTSGTIVPAHVTSEILSGGSRGSQGSRSARGGNRQSIQMHAWFDKSEMTKHIRNNSDAQHAIMEVVGKHQHIIMR